MAYDVAALRAGATGHQDVADAAERAAGAYAALNVVGAVFGRVATAAVFAASVERAGQSQGRSAAAEVGARADLAGRVRAVADLGDGLTTATTTIASGVRGSIADGLS